MMERTVPLESKITCSTYLVRRQAGQTLKKINWKSVHPEDNEHTQML